MSRQIAGLESAAGAQLFERAPRGVRLTHAGGTLLRHAVSALEQLDVAKRELTGISELASGRLRVGAFPTAIAALLPRALVAFQSRHGGIEVSLREGTTPSQLRRLSSGATQLAVVAASATHALNHGEVSFEPLLEDPLLLALPRTHPLARERVVDVNDLARERWIAASSDSGETLLGVWPSLAWQPRVAFIAREWTAKLGLVAAGLGVTVVPGLAATAVREDIALVRVHGEQPATRTIALATRSSGEESAHARAFADVLHEVASDLAVELQLRIKRH